MEEHYRRLVWAVLLIALLAVTGVGWSSLRGAPRSTVIAAVPRTVDLPAAPGGGAPSPVVPAVPMGVAGAAVPVSPGAAKAAGEAQPATSAPAGSRVHVVGAVRRPGVYTLAAGARVIDALEKAGGARADADLEAINLADFVRDGEQVHVPSRRRPRVARTPAAAARVPTAIRTAPRAPTAPTRSLGRYPAAAAAPAPSASASSGNSNGVVNVNTAGLEELDTLPGVGPATAQAIIDYRREHGPFQRPEDLMNVRGIGEKKLANMLARVRVR